MRGKTQRESESSASSESSAVRKRTRTEVKMPTTLFAKANHFFGVDTVVCASSEAKLVPMGTTLGDQLLGVATLKWLMQHEYTSPACRQLFEANVVMNRFVKDVIFADDVDSFLAEFPDGQNAHSVADAFELYVFSLHHFGKLSVEDVCTILEPYFTWVEGAVQMDDITASKVIVGGAQAEIPFESLARHEYRSVRAPEIAEARCLLNVGEGSSPSSAFPSPVENRDHRSEPTQDEIEATRRRSLALASAPASLVTENIFAEASLPITAIAPRSGYGIARDHVIPEPVTLEWVSRIGNPQSVSFFYCCGQLAVKDPSSSEEGRQSYFSDRKCWCDAALAGRMHVQKPLLTRQTKSQACNAVPIAMWTCCTEVVRAKPQLVLMLPTLATNPCPHTDANLQQATVFP